jgi:hypothetical protein
MTRAGSVEPRFSNDVIRSGMPRIHTWFVVPLNIESVLCRTTNNPMDNHTFWKSEGHDVADTVVKLPPDQDKITGV